MVPSVQSVRSVQPKTSLKARFMGPTWGPSGADRTQVGPILAPGTLLCGMASAGRKRRAKSWRHSDHYNTAITRGSHLKDPPRNLLGNIESSTGRSLLSNCWIYVKLEITAAGWQMINNWQLRSPRPIVSLQWNLSVTTTSNKIYYLWFIQWCVLMKTEGTNLPLLTISAFWSSSRWPRAT